MSLVDYTTKVIFVILLSRMTKGYGVEVHSIVIMKQKHLEFEWFKIQNSK